MPGNTAHGYPYAVPDDALVNWPATSKALADKLESMPRVAGGTGTGTTDAGGALTIQHGLGVKPRAVVANMAGSSATSRFYTVVASVLDATSARVFIIKDDGTPLANASVSIYWIAIA